MENLNSLLEFLVDLEKKKCAAWEKELEEMPEGLLCVHFRAKHVTFQREISRKRNGISKDIDLIYRLARKRYLKVLIKERKEILSMAARRLRASDIKTSVRAVHFTPVEKLLKRYGEAGLDILRITCTEKQYRWAKAEYRRNLMRPEELKFETYSGIKVRSKSEQAIGNALEIRGIPYRYEMEIELEVGWMEGVQGAKLGKYKNYYPDFVILGADGSYIFWEHFGRNDLENYRAHNGEKLAAYRECGLCDEAHLILTFERDMKKPETLREIIEHRIIPYV